MGYSDEWSGHIPEEYDRSEALPQFKQQLYEYWKRGEGPCNGCPNREFRDSCEPSFGSGSHEADILLVGSAPGPRKRSLQIDNKGRRIKPEKLKELPEFDGPALCTFYDRTINDMKSWQGFSTLRKRFIEDERGLGTDLEEDRIYFTNAKKCCNIQNRGNHRALKKCEAYLSNEISLISPNVIVSWGEKAAKGAARVLGYDTADLPDRTMSLPTGDIRPTDSFLGYRDTNPPLITMPHWGMLGTNSRHIPDFDPEEVDRAETHIYFELAKLVNHLSKSAE